MSGLTAVLAAAVLALAPLSASLTEASTVTLFTANTVHMQTAPPTYDEPNSTGFTLPAGLTSWTLSVQSSKYAAGSSADLGVEYLYGSTWVQVASVGGFTLGAYSCDGGGITGVTNTPNPTITTADIDTLVVGQPITISGVQGATGVNGNWTVASVIDNIHFTISLATAPGVYTGGGTCSTSTNRLSALLIQNGMPYPSAARIRIDRIPNGQLDNVTLTGS